jgi:predicted DNA-binding protein (MmcQ/YjbR family)
MDIENIRRYCLSLDGATEDLKPQWGDALLFRIGGKIFVSTSLAEVPLRLNLKCTPERCAELLEVEGVQRAAYVGRYDWIDVPASGVFRESELRSLIRESYDNIRAKLPKATGKKSRSTTRPSKSPKK